MSMASSVSAAGKLAKEKGMKSRGRPAASPPAGLSGLMHRLHDGCHRRDPPIRAMWERLVAPLASSGSRARANRVSDP
jgi:hypothetical protein